MKITDKMRLDWFEENGTKVVATYNNPRTQSDWAQPQGWFVFDGSFNPGKRFRRFRKAIDAAIRAGERNKI